MSSTTDPSSSVAEASSLPVKYGVILFRAFEPLDVFGPVEALQLLSRNYKMDLFLLSETMDPVTTEPVTPAMNPCNSNFFTNVLPTHTLDSAPSDIEVLIIPGGLGSRSPMITKTIDYVAKMYPRLRYLITVCTGAGIAAKAGVLDGKRATTNKASWSSTIKIGPNVQWVPHARWVEDGNIWTSSGISAGIDVILAFIEKIYSKEDAITVANKMEYETHLDPTWDPFAAIWSVEKPTEGGN